MKPKTLVLMVVAVTCGLGASYMTSRLLAERHNTEAVETVGILVAKKNLNNGETIKVPQDLFVEKRYPVGEEPHEAITKLDDLKGRILKRALREGDFIRPDDLMSANDPAAAFSYNMPTGFRAMGLRVNLESIAAGFASLPLSRVDLIQTVRRGDDKSSYAKLLLENVLVLAADGRTVRDEGGNAMPATIVVFALSPEDVLKVNLAREMGPLSLALRKFNDNQKSPIDVVTGEDIRNGTSGGKITDEYDLAEGLPTPSVDPSPVAGISLPPLKADDAKPAVDVKTEVVVAPVTKNHTLVIIEGETSRPISYVLDVNGRVLNQDVSRTEVVTRPPQVVAPKTDE